MAARSPVCEPVGVGFPPRPPGAGEGGSHPFGRRAFVVGWIGCGVTIVLGLLMRLSGDGDLRAVGLTMVVLAVVCLVTTGVLVAAERAVARRRPEPPAAPRRRTKPPGTSSSNGHRP
jgi:hypothetical protein